MKNTNNFTEKLLIDLIKIPSETKSEQKILNYLLNFLKTLKLKIRTIPVENDRFCILTTSGKPNILFVSHIDTVVGQLPIFTDENFVYGRGACDNKSSVSTMLTAIKNALDEKLDNFGILITIGEESDLIGTKISAEFLQKNKISPNLVIIGEPTNLQFVTAQKCILSVDLDFKGKASHSSQPPLDSAIHKLIKTTSILLKLNNKGNIVNIGKINGGIAENISADVAHASLLIRSSEKDIKEKTLKILDKCDCKYQVRMYFEAKNNSTPDFPYNGVNYFSEMYFFKKSIIFGAGNIKLAHSNKEKVSKKQLKKASETYLNLIKKYS